MKRRTALVTSAAVSVFVLGGTVAAAALSGGGLGFHPGASGSFGSATQPSGTDQASQAGPGRTPDGSSGGGIQVKVIEDRVVVHVVETGTGTGSGSSTVQSTIRGIVRGHVSNPTTTQFMTDPTVPPGSTTTTTAAKNHTNHHPHDDDSEAGDD